MATHCLKLLFVVSISLPFLLFFFPSFASARFSQKVSEDIQNQICSKSDDPTYCSQFLKSIPDSNTVNLHDLTQSVISLAHNASNDNHGTMESLISQTSDPELKKRYTSCSNDFSQASDSLLKGDVSYQSAKFLDASVAAKDAGADGKNCENEFNTSPFLPSYLQQRIQQFQTLSSIIQISIEILIRQNN